MSLAIRACDVPAIITPSDVMATQNTPTPVRSWIPTELKPTLAIGGLSFFGIVVAYQIIGVDVLRSDMESYVNWSYQLGHHVGFASHMPGYPALIALARGITNRLVSDTALAQIICLISWVVAAGLACELLRQLAPKASRIGVLAYALAPFVGVFLAVFAVAEMVAFPFLLGATLAVVRGRGWWFAILTAFGLLVHQAFYPFYFLVGLAGIQRGQLKWVQFLSSGSLFALYYVAVAVSLGSANWIVAYQSATHVQGQTGLPVFDGILGNLMRLEPTYLAKGSILLTIFGAAMGLTIHFLRRKDWLQLALIAPILVYAVISNERIAFLLIRMSKLMVFPACVWLSTQTRLLALAQRRVVYGTLAGLLVLTQLAWAAYFVIFFR